MIVFSVMIGLLWLSTVPLTSGLVALMFGTRYVGMLFGFVFLSHQIGAFIGVWLGGGSTTPPAATTLMWWLAVALGLFAARRPSPDPRAQGAASRRRTGMSARLNASSGSAWS